MQQRARTDLPEPDPRERALARTMGLPDLMARVLLARGFDDPDRIRAWLRPEFKALHDPFLFRDMRKAVDRVRRAVQTGEPILIHGDYDVDGISSTVLLLKFFSLMQVPARPFIPARTDGYSFGERSIEAVKEGGFGLVISVDNGTNACEPIRRIQELGCDVIITDHHGTSENVAPAYAVLNPRLPGAGYPDRDLAGVGVAFRLAAAVAESFSQGMRLNAEFHEFLADAMTYVALGTIADVAPLLGENRILVHHGIRALACSRNPGIRALLDSAGLTNRSPDVEDVAFRVAPLINAAGRMGQAQEAVDLLMAPGYAEAQAAAKVLERHNSERRRVERKLQEEVLDEAMASEDPVLVLAGDDWHPGVLGIVAARVAEVTDKPTILVAFSGDVGRGSGRCASGFHLRNALAACGEHLVAHGGHAAAAGLEVERRKMPAFRAAMQELCRKEDVSGNGRPVDGTAEFTELDPQVVRRLEMLGPFGMGNPRPIFAAPEVRVVGCPTVDSRGMDLRFRVARDGMVMPARIPRGAHRHEEVRSLSEPVTLVFSPRLNPRGEEGPVHLDVHELAPGSAARA